MDKLRIDTTIYTVRIINANPGAWYRKSVGIRYDCLHDQVYNPITGYKDVFKVLGAFHPIKYIMKDHCVVLRKRIASHKELMKKHEGN